MYNKKLYVEALSSPNMATVNKYKAVIAISLLSLDFCMIVIVQSTY